MERSSATKARGSSYEDNVESCSYHADTDLAENQERSGVTKTVTL